MNLSGLIRSAIRVTPWELRLLVKNIPGVATLQRMLIAATLDGKTFVHEVDAGPAKGVRFEITLPDDKGILTGTYEARFASLVAAAVRSGAVCYDIGGWHGFFAGVFAARGARSVHIFEPLPENIRLIRRMIGLNPGLPLTLHEIAVGDCESRGKLKVMPASSMAKLSVSRFQQEATDSMSIVVSIRSLDAMITAGEIPPPNVVKIDVEGAELMVLRGAKALLEVHRPELFIEVHSSSLLAECRNMLQLIGYSVGLIDDDPDAAAARDVFAVHATFARTD